MFLVPNERIRAEGEARESALPDRETQAELAHANRVATMGYLAASIVHEVKQPIAANAIEAMTGISEGPRELLVTTEKAKAGGVLVSVRDSGPGLKLAV